MNASHKMGGVASKLSAVGHTLITTTAIAHFATRPLSVAKQLTGHDCAWPVFIGFSLFHRPLVGCYEVSGVLLAIDRMPHVGECVSHGWNVPARKVLLDADPSRTRKACELSLVKGPTYLPPELPHPSPVRASTIVVAQVPRSEDLRGKNGGISLAVSNKAVHNLTLALCFILLRSFHTNALFARNALRRVCTPLRHTILVAEPRKQSPCQRTPHGTVHGGTVCLHSEEQKQHGSQGLCTKHHHWVQDLL